MLNLYLLHKKVASCRWLTVGGGEGAPTEKRTRAVHLMDERLRILDLWIDQDKYVSIHGGLPRDPTKSTDKWPSCSDGEAKSWVKTFRGVYQQ